jgi:hypothetical protein
MKTKFNTDFRIIKGEEAEKLSVSQCRKILAEEACELNDEEIIEIRDYFYHLAAITMEQYHSEKTNEPPVINLEHYKTTQDEKESNYLRTG